MHAVWLASGALHPCKLKGLSRVPVFDGSLSAGPAAILWDRGVRLEWSIVPVLPCYYRAYDLTVSTDNPWPGDRPAHARVHGPPA